MFKYHIWRGEQNVLLRMYLRTQKIYWQSLRQNQTFSHKIFPRMPKSVLTSLVTDITALTCQFGRVSRVWFYRSWSSTPNLWAVWGLCVLQSCVWPTLPSHRRSTASLTPVALSEILGLLAFWFNILWFCLFLFPHSTGILPGCHLPFPCIYVHISGKSHRSALWTMNMSVLCWSFPT